MTQLVERGFFKSQIILATPHMGGKPENPSGKPQNLANPDVQVLRVGKFDHPIYGEFEITKTILAEMKSNFDAKIRGVDIAFDYFHESDKEASGWPTDLYLNADGNELWAHVDWTPAAQQKLAEREIRYFSPDFAFEWKDPESGKIFKNVLFGGGLTNRPFVKEMAAIVAAETKEETMKLEELEKAVKKLAEEGGDLKAQHEALKKDHDELKKKHEEVKAKLAEHEPPVAEEKAEGEVEDGAEDVESLKKKLVEMSEHSKKLEKELMDMKEGKKLAEKEASFNVLLSEGKACVAQKDAFMKGDMHAFAKLSQPLNLSERGSSESVKDDETDLAVRVLKLAEELHKKDPQVSLVDCISLAKKQVK